MTWHGSCGLDVPESNWRRSPRPAGTFPSSDLTETAAAAIHFSSAMTLLGKDRWISAADGSSYLDLAAFIRPTGHQPRRIWSSCGSGLCFSMAESILTTTCATMVSADTHRLAAGPLYDVNPVPSGETWLSLNGVR